MFDKPTSKFIIILLGFVIVSFFLSYNLLSCAQGGVTGGSGQQGEKSLVALFVLIYSIALGFLAVFNTHNALEVYKKKEQLDKEVQELLNKLHLVKVDYKQIELDVRSTHNNLGKELSTLREEYASKMSASKAELEQTCGEIESVRKNMQFDLIELNKRQEEVEKSIKDTFEDYKVFKEAMDFEFKKHQHSYNLYSLIPKYIFDNDRNRGKVKAAAWWLSQSRDEEALEILKERRGVVSENDADLLEVFDKAIAFLKRSIYDMEDKGDIV